ncbi:MAG: prepilin-type N-terminal cleavage/methylation domain-containing protein [Candidatus Moranbacteria bacterium]|nr:prepilin-type N-terminal cleavage/methylation domain-containing protein [Candidatus Moranbacteria bacterium]
MKIPKLKLFSGFTIIELLVVIAIISIITVVLLLSFGDSRVKKELETNANEFAGVVREAQNYALTGKQAGGGTVCAFSVTWTTPSTYSLGYTASGSCATAPTSLVSYSLKNGVIFSNSGAVSFKSPWAEVTTGDVQVNFSRSGNTHSVCVNAEGKISEGITCP